MPRPLRANKVQKLILLPEDLTYTVELLLTDPLSRRAAYGSWSQLCERLLRQWIADQRSQFQQMEKAS